ncbi:MAG: NAD(P)-binding protein, partial [Clostridia bacterium]|nr:NAD(P)-binding protein [Clostridia bacterium]
MEKILIVGAGLSGATAARVLAEKGNSVIVLDRRSMLGGNVYDYVDKNGITVQMYGPHIFHTNEKEVFDFLSRFTEWTKYEHRVLADIYGKLVPVPFNLTSLENTFSKEKAERIKRVLLNEIGEGKKVPILKLKEHENAEIRDFANYVYKNIFYFYTQKQWGFRPEELGEAVMNRVPVYVSYEDRYFTDEYQFMPEKGFTEMVSNILRHPNIQLKLNTDASKIISLHDGDIYLNG